MIPVGFGMLTGGIAFFFLTRCWSIPTKLSPSVLFITAVIVLLGTASAFTLFLRGTALIGPARANMVGCLEPLVATICSAVFLQTIFMPMDLLVFAFILSTVFLLSKKE